MDLCAQLYPRMQHWQASGTGGVWVKVPIARAPLIPELVAQGFAYHHAEPVRRPCHDPR